MDNTLSKAPLDEEGFALTDRWYCEETSTYYPAGTTIREIEKDMNDALEENGMENKTLVTYTIDTSALEEEAWYRFTDFGGEDEFTEEEYGKLIDRMLAEASATCASYSGKITNFDAWMDNSRLSDTIAYAIHDAIWEYVNRYLNDHLRKED